MQINYSAYPYFILPGRHMKRTMGIVLAAGRIRHLDIKIITHINNYRLLVYRQEFDTDHLFKKAEFSEINLQKARL